MKTLEKIIETKPGAPDNPNSKTGSVFPGNYLMIYHGGLEKFLPLLRGGASDELHVQDPSELPSTEEEYSKFRRWAEIHKENGIGMMGHSPFVAMRAEKSAFNFDFFWPVVPKEYAGKKKPVFTIKNNPLYALECSDSVMEKTIDLMSSLEIDMLTVHATKPFVYFDNEDFERYVGKIQHYADYGKQKKVEIAVETGGLSIEQIVNVSERTGCKMNLDAAHLFLDLCELHNGELKSGKVSYDDVNNEIVDFFRKYKDKIGVVHITQTAKGQDNHLGVYKLGDLTCNEDIIRGINEELKNGRRIKWMVESQADRRNFDYVVKVLKGLDKAAPEGLAQSYITVMMGLPATGKSATVSILNEDLGEIISSDALHNAQETSRVSFRKDYDIEELKQKVYEMIYERTERLAKANRIVSIDATFHMKRRREELKEILGKLDKEVYIVCHYASDETIEERFKKRKELFDSKKEKKEPIPYHLYSHEILTDNVLPNYTPFEPSEFPKAHIIMFDTTEGKENLKMYNPDSQLRSMAFKIKEHYEDKGAQINISE